MKASDLWQKLELASELESDLWDTVYWGMEWLFNVNPGKTQIVSLDRCVNTGAIDVKMDWFVLEWKLYFKMLKLSLFSYNSFIAKTASNKIGAMICSMKFLSSEVALYLSKFTLWSCMENCCHF